MLEARREVPGERAGNEVTLLLCPAPPRPPGWGMAVPGWWHRMSPPHPPPCPRPRPQQVNSTRQVPGTAASSPCQCAQHTLPSWGQVTTATEHFQPHCPSSVPWGCNPLGPSPPHPSTGKLHKAGSHPPCSECVPGDIGSGTCSSPPPAGCGAPPVSPTHVCPLSPSAPPVPPAEAAAQGRWPWPSRCHRGWEMLRVAPAAPRLREGQEHISITPPCAGTGAPRHSPPECGGAAAAWGAQEGSLQAQGAE